MRREDAAFLGDLYASTRADEVAAWGWDEAAQRLFLEQQRRLRDAARESAYPDAEDRILLSPEDEPIGRLLVWRGSHEIRLVDVALLPDWRGRGIGSRLLEDLIAEARTTGTPLRLRVLCDSPALRLYERVGFVATAQDGLYVEMLRAPTGSGRPNL